jgi:hypothetical protein
MSSRIKIGGISERAISDVFDPRDNPQTRVAQYISRSTEYRNNSRAGPKTGVTRMIGPIAKWIDWSALQLGYLVQSPPDEPNSRLKSLVNESI